MTYLMREAPKKLSPGCFSNAHARLSSGMVGSPGPRLVSRTLLEGLQKTRGKKWWVWGAADRHLSSKI